MMPPFANVVRSPPSGVEITAHVSAAIASSRANGAVDTVGFTGAVQRARVLLLAQADDSITCARQPPETRRKSRRLVMCSGAASTPRVVKARVSARWVRSASSSRHVKERDELADRQIKQECGPRSSG